jgi:hypothetical protein
MPKITIGTVLKLVLWSLAVGAVLAFFDITPQDVLGYVAGWARDAVENVQFYAGRLVTWVLLGAVVVIPIWLVSYLMKALNRRS